MKKKEEKYTGIKEVLTPQKHDWNIQRAGVSKQASDCQSSASYAVTCCWLLLSNSLPFGP